MSNPWECPRCFRINAPWLPNCSCKKEPVGITPHSMTSITTISSEKPLWNEENRCTICNGVHPFGYVCATL